MIQITPRMIVFTDEQDFLSNCERFETLLPGHPGVFPVLFVLKSRDGGIGFEQRSPLEFEDILQKAIAYHKQKIAELEPLQAMFEDPCPADFGEFEAGAPGLDALEEGGSANDKR